MAQVRGRLRNDSVKGNYLGLGQRTQKMNDVQAPLAAKDTELVLDIHQLNSVIPVQCLGNLNIFVGVILVYLKDNLPTIDISNDPFDIHGHDHRVYTRFKQTVYSLGEILSKSGNPALSGRESSHVGYPAGVPNARI
jgi:hypothetical protein